MSQAQTQLAETDKEREKELIERVAESPELLEQVLQTPQAIGALTMMQAQISHFGPLPMASEIEKYNSVIPNGADRIMKLAEREQENRYLIPKLSLFLQGVGLFFAMASVCLIVWFCVRLVEKGQYGYSVTIMISVLVSLAGVFAVGKLMLPKAERKEKEEDE